MFPLTRETNFARLLDLKFDISYISSHLAANSEVFESTAFLMDDALLEQSARCWKHPVNRQTCGPDRSAPVQDNVAVPQAHSDQQETDDDEKHE